MTASPFRLTLLALLLHSSFVSASVYRCVIDGVTTFSQTPCADDAEEMRGYDTSPTRTPSEPTAATSAQDTLAEINSDVRQRNLNRQIQQLEQRLTRLQNDYETEFVELTGEPLPEGDSMTAYPLGLAQEISALRNRYNAEIKKVRDELAQRRKELSDI
ncbi:DUF4124 domain-containing protein [Alkalimonas collagenimarina]|uniref:DUF4124 domain-containing protein n=1 Tax=Alkalimonas collagenimarina TaxID=400390 RepID=A0ABT9GW85_9GAMM|nr:DUF4124 domain-containing protein [Alkalimonas collagenimarina]MDP4535319.1 DUF4124 domain-containing protein [Alkalimonas collagenimarina]